MEPADVVAFHAGDWWRGPAESAVRAFRHMLTIGRGPLTVPGPVRPMVVGARVLDALDPTDPAGALVGRLRSMQWDLPWDVRDASPLEVSGPGDAKLRMAVWANEGDVVLPDSDYVILPGNEDETTILVLLWDRVGEVAGDAGRLLDERQWFLRRVDDATWERICAAAAVLSVAAELGLDGPRESPFLADPLEELRDEPPPERPRMPAWVPLLVIVWLVGAFVALMGLGGR